MSTAIEVVIYLFVFWMMFMLAMVLVILTVCAAANIKKARLSWRFNQIVEPPVWETHERIDELEEA